MDEFNVRVLRLENAHKRLQEANDELTERNRRLEDRVASLIATRTQGRSDVATAEHSAHQTIAADYRALVEQRLHAFARAHHKASSRTGHYADRQRVPRFLAELTRALFADLSRPLPAGEGAWNALGIARTTWTESDPLALLRADCDNLRQRANKAGLQARWDFMILKDRPLNPERQEPSSSC
ncbi:hypothetical protein, partial [Kitasatospora nipponensis]|uniref:hypothetical protein n=1 Tax=Kitasatospora nipponensis TaxID=258049 RepID=UPI0031E41BC3